MLMYHSDAQGDRIGRAVDINLFCVDKYLAAVRPIKPIRDAHDRRFARAVLADDRMDSSRMDSKRDVVVSDDLAKRLCNVFQFEHYFAIASVTLISPATIFALASSALAITSSGIRPLLFSSIA